MNPLLSVRGSLITGFVLAILFAVIAVDGGWNELGLARWLHIIAGITWIGLLYYFNAVQVPALAEAAVDKGGPGGAGITKYVALLPTIVIERIIHSERQRVFDIVANYENFQNILPKYFPSVRVRSIRENIAIVEEHLRLGDKELVMTTKHVTKYPESHYDFVLGGDAKGSHISETYEKIPQGTKLTVIADIKLKGMMKIAGLFAKSKIQSEFSKVIDEFCVIAEKP